MKNAVLFFLFPLYIFTQHAVTPFFANQLSTMTAHSLLRAAPKTYATISSTGNDFRGLPLKKIDLRPRKSLRTSLERLHMHILRHPLRNTLVPLVTLKNN